MGERRSRGVIVLGALALIIGTLVVLTTLDSPFVVANSPDVRLLRLIHLDTFGGVLTVMVGALALVGGIRRTRGAALTAGVLASALGLWSLIGLNTALNLMSARADAFTFFLMIGSGLLLFTLTPDPDA